MCINYYNFIYIFFIIIIIFIGLFNFKNIKNFRQYTVGDRNLSPLSLAISLALSFVTASSLINSASYVNALNLSYIMMLLGGVTGCLLTAYIVKRKFQYFANKLTIGEVFAEYYGKQNQILSGLFSLPFGMIYIISQIYVLNTLISYFFNNQAIQLLFIILATIAIYNFAGGIKAIFAVRKFYAFFAVISLILTLEFVLNYADGYQGVYNHIIANNIGLKYNFDNAFEIFILCSLPYLQPPILQHIFASVNNKVSSESFKHTALFFLLSQAVILMIILLLIAITTDNLNDNILLYILDNHIPLFSKTLIILGIIALAMSTIDINLNATSTNFVNDFIIPLSKKDKKVNALLWSRCLSIILIATAIFIVLYINKIKFILVFAHYCWVPTILPILFSMLLGLRFNKNIISLAIISGITTSILLKLTLFKNDNYILVFIGFFMNCLILAINYIFKNKKSFPLLEKLYRSDIYSYLNFASKNFSAERSRLIDKLMQKAEQEMRIHYKTFAVFSMINYTFPYFMWGNISKEYYSPLIVRFASGICCIIVLIKDKLPRTYDNFFTIMWFITITLCLPFMTTFMLLLSNISTLWLINSGLSLFLLAILVGWLGFILLNLIGISLAFFFFHIMYDLSSIYSIDFNTSYLAVYIILFSTIIGVLFSRPKHRMKEDLARKNLEITKLNETLESKIAKRTEKLQLALDVKKDLLNNVSHEVRTPMMVMNNAAKLLVDNWQNEQYSEAQKKELAYTVLYSTEKLYNYVSNLLDLSKFDSGKMLFEIQPGNIKSLIKIIVKDFAEIAKNNRVKFELIIDENVPDISHFDEFRIQQVLKNLLSNAIKYGGQGTVQVRVELLEKYLKIYGDKWDAIKVSITDNGIGIPDKELHKIFDIFEQSSFTKTYAGGSGLGLAICKEIITAHKGEIYAENKTNIDPTRSVKGSIFSFIYPVNEPKDKFLAGENTKSIKKEKASSKVSDLNILLVDDDLQVLSTTTMLLESQKFNVIKAEGGVEAIEKINNEASKLDLILLDIMMPDLNGIEVLNEVKEIIKKYDIKVIIQSGIDDKDRLQEALKLGATDHISKPYSLEDISDKINLLFSKKSA